MSSSFVLSKSSFSDTSASPNQSRPLAAIPNGSCCSSSGPNNASSSSKPQPLCHSSKPKDDKERSLISLECLLMQSPSTTNQRHRRNTFFYLTVSDYTDFLLRLLVSRTTPTICMCPTLLLIQTFLLDYWYRVQYQQSIFSTWTIGITYNTNNQPLGKKPM